tara:strand:+ start:495 stop:728 length:234 start_codon:yes stop_codon:yes gene_type:complete
LASFWFLRHYFSATVVDILISNEMFTLLMALKSTFAMIFTNKRCFFLKTLSKLAYSNNNNNDDDFKWLLQEVRSVLV